MEDSEKRIQVKYILDSTGFNSSLQGINSELKVNQAELKNAQVGLKSFGDTTENLVRVQEALGTQIATQSEKVAVYTVALDKATAKMELNVAARDALQQSISMETAKLEGAIAAYGAENEVTLLIQERIVELTEEYNAMSTACETNAKSVNNATVAQTKAQTELARLQGQILATNESIATNSNMWINAGKSLESVGGTLTKVGKSVESVGNTLIELSAPIVAATALGAKFSTDFEDGLAKISTIADTTQLSINDIGNGVIDLSNKTGKSTSDLNEALYQAISSGVQTGDTLQFMDTSAKSAIGGFTDTETAVDGLTTVLNSYGLKSSEVTDISNQMMVAQNLGKTTFGELAQQMGNVTPIASALGVTTKELFSSLGVLTANGIQTREAVTGLKAAMGNIIKPSKEAGDAAKALGIDFDASTVKTKGWLPFLEDVKNKLKQSSPEFAKASDEVNTLTQRQTELAKSGKKSSDEYKNNATALKNAKAEMNSLEQASNGQLSAFATMFGSVEGLNSILTLTSDQGMSLYNTSMDQMGSSTDYISDAFNKVSNTDGKNLEKTLNELKNSMIKLGESATPILEDADVLIGKITDTLNGMSKEQITAIEDAGLLALGLGIVGKVAGGLITTVGNVTKVIGEVSKAFGGLEVATATAEATGAAVAEVGAGAAGAEVGVGALGLALGGAVIAAAPWLLAGAAVAGTGYLIYKGMNEKAIPSVDLFANKVNTTSQQVVAANGVMTSYVETSTTKISEATKTAVGAYIKLDDEAKKSLTDLYVNGTVLTDQTVTALVGKYNDMGTQIKAGMDKHYNDEYSTMQQFFQKSSSLSDKEENDALAKMQKNNNDKKIEVDNATKQIQEILNTASENNRALTLDEQQKINSIQENMKTNAVKSLSDGEVESKIILERLKDYGTSITAEQASNEIQNANKARDESVQAANEQYDKTVAEIIRMRDETGVITAEQADKLIADAQRQKDDSITKAGELRDGVVTKIKGMDTDIESSVDTTSGNILTWWDKLKNWWDSWFPQPKTITINQDGGASTDLPWNRNNQTGENWTGNENWEGGYTTLHEKGYEVYDLPSGTKIYNHDSSEDLVLKTAESVASKVANRIAQNSTGSSANSQPIVLQIPVVVDGREIARASATYVGTDLAFNTNRKGW